MLRVLLICRIGTIHQDALSLDDQRDMLERLVTEAYGRQIEFEVIATQASGEHLDRAELLRVAEKVATRNFDLVLMEDLGRYVRDFQAISFCGHCVDHDTRLVAVNDHLDTAQENWQDAAVFSSWRHTKYQHDTASRIKRSLRGRFQRDGGVVIQVVYGYEKPAGAKSDAEIRRLDSAAPHVELAFARILREDASFSSVADEFNKLGVPVGPAMRQSKWDGKSLARWLTNPLLSGRRVRNRMHTVKHHGSGHRRSVRAPADQLLIRDVPHLAFVTVEEHEALLEKMRKRNAIYRRRKIDGVDPRAGVPKKRTRWPGQHLWCAICGRMFA